MTDEALKPKPMEHAAIPVDYPKNEMNSITRKALFVTVSATWGQADLSGRSGIAKKILLIGVASSTNTIDREF
jgi:hypothetical protein